MLEVTGQIPQLDENNIRQNYAAVDQFNQRGKAKL